tara:strand:+ start:225 stop:614 length:390 start_codon:yes stop_codon:yes gene_type:complete
MAKPLTIKATQIIVDSIYDNTKKCALDNISKDMQTNSDYQDISFTASTIRQLKAEVSELEERNKKAVEQFNKTFGHEYFYLKRPYWGDERPEFAETGLRSAIEADVVIANLGDSVDFDDLKKKLEEKYA